MKTARRIAVVVGAVASIVAAVVVIACVLLGPRTGLLCSALALVVLVVAYQRLIAPWHARWGATPEEVARRFDGDDLVEHATATTRAVSIAAPPEAVWPWLVQIGFGRAGWYSYDWLDNDGAASSTEVIGELQDLAPGDRIPMTPDLGFVVQALAAPTSIVSLSDDGSTSWALDLVSQGGGCRLISRFRTPPPKGVAGLVWAAIAGPGAFIMERRMLRGIRARAESCVAISRS